MQSDPHDTLSLFDAPLRSAGGVLYCSQNNQSHPPDAAQHRRPKADTHLESICPFPTCSPQRAQCPRHIPLRSDWAAPSSIWCFFVQHESGCQYNCTHGLLPHCSPADLPDTQPSVLFLLSWCIPPIWDVLIIAVAGMLVNEMFSCVYKCVIDGSL